MPYPEMMIHGMRQELAQLGIEETKTPEAVQRRGRKYGRNFDGRRQFGLRVRGRRRSPWYCDGAAKFGSKAGPLDHRICRSSTLTDGDDGA